MKVRFKLTRQARKKGADRYETKKGPVLTMYVEQDYSRPQGLLPIKSFEVEFLNFKEGD